MKAHFFFLLLLVNASVALAQGEYQRTKDGRTIVWNDAPKPGDVATWFGARDRERYATGLGTLTWYHADKAVYARYFGNMRQGKFEGPVNVHSKGKTAHAVFIEGKKTTRWVNGPTPSRTVAQQPLIATAKKQEQEVEPEPPAKAPPPERAKPPAPPARIETVAPEKSDEDVRPEPEAMPSPPATTPSPTTTPEVTPTATPKKLPIAKLPPTKVNKSTAKKTDNSLQLLARPPSSLHNIPDAPPAAPAETGPRLTKEEVVDLASAEVRRRGYDPSENQSAQPEYKAADGTWSLPYDLNAGDEMEKQHFNVIVDDKTKGTVFVPRK